jgi:hypothetical protein
MFNCVVIACETRTRTLTTGYLSNYGKMSFVKSFPTLHQAAQLFKEHHVDFLFLHVPNIFMVAEYSVLLAKLKAVGTRIVVISKNRSVVKYSLPIADDFVTQTLTAERLYNTFLRGEILKGATGTD